MGGESEHKYISETKGEYGFELGFEKHINWYSEIIDKSKKEFIFDLMIQLWEEENHHNRIE